MHRATALVAIGLMFLPVVSACGSDGGNQSSEGSRLQVVASTSIIAALAREVAGERADVTSLTGPDTDPHVYDPSPGDIRAVGDAGLILMNGLGLDDHLIDDVEAASSGAPIVVVTESVDLISGDEHGEEREDEREDEGEEREHGEFDPHVWQDPLRVKVLVDNIAAALGEVDPDNASAYREAAGAYNLTLDETHQEIQTLIDQIPARQRKIVTNHEAFGYFADRYGLEIVGTVIPGASTEADPSAAQIAGLIELIEREGVSAIFVEEVVNADIAEQIAGDTGVQIVTGLYADQVGPEGSSAETVHEMLLANARKISDALR